MLPAASVSGLYFSHPRGASTSTSAASAATRSSRTPRGRGMPVEEVERWLGSNAGLRSRGGRPRPVLIIPASSRQSLAEPVKATYRRFAMPSCSRRQSGPDAPTNLARRPSDNRSSHASAQARPGSWAAVILARLVGIAAPRSSARDPLAVDASRAPPDHLNRHAAGFRPVRPADGTVEAVQATTVSTPRLAGQTSPHRWSSRGSSARGRS